jgi:hypothetical protein
MTCSATYVMVMKGLIDRDAAGHIVLTDRGHAVFRAMLLD